MPTFSRQYLTYFESFARNFSRINVIFLQVFSFLTRKAHTMKHVLSIHNLFRSVVFTLVIGANVAVFAKDKSFVVPTSHTEAIELKESPIFKLYPNPSDGKLIGLLLENVLNQQGVVTIYNSIGSKIVQKNIPAVGAKRVVQISLDNTLRPGLYLLTFSIGDLHHTERLMVK